MLFSTFDYLVYGTQSTFLFAFLLSLYMQAHKHKGHYRSSDNAVYFGDRSAPGGGVLGGQQRRGELKTMYEPVQVHTNMFNFIRRGEKG